MGATPGRPIEKIETAFESRVLVKFYDEYERHNLTDLARTELIAVASLIGADRSGQRWMNFTNDQVIERINARMPFNTVYVPRKVVAEDWKKDWRVDDDQADDNDIDLTDIITDQTPSPRLSEILADDPKPQPSPTMPTDDAVKVTALASALAELMSRPTNAPIDESVVIDLVDTAVKDAETRIMAEIVRPVVHRIEVPGRPVVELEGHKHAMFAPMVRLIGAGLHTYLVGPPGTGKSTLAHQAADALQLEFGSISCGPTTPASQIWGYQDANGQYHRTIFRERFEHGGVFLLDEIDHSHAGVLTTINAALANGVAAFPDGMVTRHDDFVCLAAANTYGTGATAEFVGATPLNAATLDRFVMLEVVIDEELETTLTYAATSNRAMADELLTMLRTYRKNAETHKLKVILSPRAAIDGAKMIEAGFSLADVEVMRIFRGVKADVVAKIKGEY